MKVCIIGAGIVGLTVAYDLALRGIDCLIIEKGVPGCGTTTHCAGMLHSGARYVVKSPTLAKQCMTANTELHKTVPFAINHKNGLFLCLKTDPPDYAERFVFECEKAGIEIVELSLPEALEIEPNLGSMVSKAFLTPDGVIDPFILVEAYVERLKDIGVEILNYHSLNSASNRPHGWFLEIENLKNKKIRTIETNIVINASGAGAAEVLKAFDIPFPLLYIHGTMLVLNDKRINSLVTRCAPSSSGDVIITTKNACLVGSTSHQLPHNNAITLSKQDVNDMIKTSKAMIPSINHKLIIHSFTGIRVHQHNTETSEQQDDFDIPRNFSIVDHSKHHGVSGIITVLGGKLTLHRIVAEIAGDLVGQKLGIDCVCQIRNTPLPQPSKPSGRSLSNRL